MSSLFKMNAQEYKNASEERNMLYESISDLKEENYNLKEQYNSYINDENDSTNIVESMSSQLNDYYTIGGLTEVEGPGIVVKIEDGDYDIHAIGLLLALKMKAWRWLLFTFMPLEILNN